MKRFSPGFWPVLALFAATGCAGTAVTPGSPHSVAKAAAAAYVAAGHKCDVRGDLVYCDTTGGVLPLLMGYDQKDQKLLFATVLDTQAAFGRACPTVPAEQIMRPDWMIVKCDEVEFADKSKKVVLSVLGGGRIPDEGMSRAELNRSAGVFIQEAEGYLLRLQAAVAQGQARQTRTFVPSPEGSTKL